MKSCVFAGSFDPITKGHIDIVESSLSLFDKTYVAICENVSKNQLFTKAQRVEMAKVATSHLTNVEVIFVEGLLTDFMIKNNIKINVRGLRNSRDFEYENSMQYINKLLMQDMQVVYIPAKIDNAMVTSTVVRELINFNKDITDFVPNGVACLVKKYLNKA